jgi:hypothetical protein
MAKQIVHGPKERPILFSAPMVRALLDGSKTQTRRVVKPVPEMVTDRTIKPWVGDAAVLMKLLEQAGRHCPYGQPGDRLWVRETWGVVSNAWGEDGALIDWTPDRPATSIHEMPFGKGYYSGHAIYSADGSHEWSGDDDGGGEPRSAWHPSIHMPRAASRILLEIGNVRVERLQDISDADARAEGCGGYETSPFAEPVPPSGEYREVWDRINGLGSWDANPWVWVIAFCRIEPVAKVARVAA